MIYREIKEGRKKESVGRMIMPSMIAKQTVFSGIVVFFALIGCTPIALSLPSQSGLVSQGRIIIQPQYAYANDAQQKT
jgi:hypothetical protein